jgi:hypothetical protein
MWLFVLCQEHNTDISYQCRLHWHPFLAFAIVDKLSMALISWEECGSHRNDPSRLNKCQRGTHGSEYSVRSPGPAVAASHSEQKPEQGWHRSRSGSHHILEKGSTTSISICESVRRSFSWVERIGEYQCDDFAHPLLWKSNQFSPEKFRRDHRPHDPSQPRPDSLEVLSMPNPTEWRQFKVKNFWKVKHGKIFC